MSERRPLSGLLNSLEILALSGRREEAAASQNTLFISGTFLQMQVLLAFGRGQNARHPRLGQGFQLLEVHDKDSSDAVIKPRYSQTCPVQAEIGTAYRS